MIEYSRRKADFERQQSLSAAPMVGERCTILAVILELLIKTAISEIH